MRLLLDTHSLIWLVEGDAQLSSPAKLAISDANNQCFVSIVTFWEMAIKISLQKLQITVPFENLKALVTAHNIEILPITFEHTKIIVNMPSHHKDPFDRLLIAQAQCEGMALVGKDGKFSPYGIHVIW
ncbi:MAG: type II toxin-antitoxin system VapC family toxin [Gallionella sp.]